MESQDSAMGRVIRLVVALILATSAGAVAAPPTPAEREALSAKLATFQATVPIDEYMEPLAY